MITLGIRNSIGTVGFYNYSFDTSSLEVEGVTYAEYDGETGFYEREPFEGRSPGKRQHLDESRDGGQAHDNRPPVLYPCLHYETLRTL